MHEHEPQTLNALGLEIGGPWRELSDALGLGARKEDYREDYGDDHNQSHRHQRQHH